MRRVDHQGSLCNCRVIGNVADKPFHLSCTVEHGVVHVDVNDGCTILDLLCGYLKRLVIFAL